MQSIYNVRFCFGMSLLSLFCLVILQWHTHNSYISLSRKSLQYAYRNLDGFLSEFDNEKHDTIVLGKKRKTNITINKPTSTQQLKLASSIKSLIDILEKPKVDMIKTSNTKSFKKLNLAGSIKALWRQLENTPKQEAPSKKEPPKKISSTKPSSVKKIAAKIFAKILTKKKNKNNNSNSNKKQEKSKSSSTSTNTNNDNTVNEIRETKKNNKNNNDNSTTVEDPPDECMDLGSTMLIESKISTLIIVPIPEEDIRNAGNNVEKLHSDFAKQFVKPLNAHVYHIIFIWNFALTKMNPKTLKLLDMLKHTVTSILLNPDKYKNVHITFLTCTEKDKSNHNTMEKEIRNSVRPYLKTFDSLKKKIIVTSVHTRFMEHKLGNGKINTCANVKSFSKQHGCDCSWAKSHKSCINDNSNCFKACCCKYYDPTGFDRLTNGYLIQHEKRFEHFNTIYAIGGYKIGKDKKVGLPCFTQMPRQKEQQLPELVRVYKKNIDAGHSDDGKHINGESFGICDLVEMPLSVNPYKKTEETISILVSAAFTGHGHLAAPKARNMLNTKYLGQKSGSFGFLPYFTSSENNFQVDKYVSFKNTAYKLWKKDSLCFTGRDARTRPSLLYDVSKTINDIVSTENELTYEKNSFNAVYGSLLTPMKVGSLPPWEFDMDLDFIMDLPFRESSPSKLQSKCRKILTLVKDRGPKSGFHIHDIKCGKEAGVDFKKSKVKCIMNVNRKKDKAIFFPHWNQICGDLKRCPDCWILDPEIWKICLKRIQDITSNGKKMKGYERKEGLKFEIACMASTPHNIKRVKNAPKIAIADPTGSGETFFVKIFFHHNSNVLSEESTLQEFGNWLPSPWQCPWKEK